MTTVDDAHTAPPVMDTEPEPDGPRRWRRGLVWFALGGAVIAAAGAGAWLWATDTSSEPAPATGPAATATVERGTIAATESWDGTLDHGTPFTVTGSGEGTITRLVDQGAAVERADELYRIDERPVTLLYGVVPMFRDLGPGDSGADVGQLEANLAELGFDGFTVDEEYTWSTAEAVRAWQEDIGAEQTGTVARSDVIFVPEGGQVDTLRARVGDVVEPARAILDIAGTDQVASLEVDVDDRDRFEVGTEVTVLLPGGAEVAGTVSATAVVEVVSEDADGAGDTDSGSVVPVETGLFAEGKVEVDSADIAEGTVVGVAER